MTGGAQRSHLCWISSAHAPQGYQVNRTTKSLHREEKKAALLFKIYYYKAAIKAFSSCLIEWTPHQLVCLASVHSVVYQWGLVNYQSIRYGGVTVPNEICLPIMRSNWTQLSQQFTLSRRCVALWWIIVPVWLAAVISSTSAELLQPRRPPPATTTARAHICFNLRRRQLSIFWRNFRNPVCFAAKIPRRYTRRPSKITKYLTRLWKNSWLLLICSARFRFWKLRKFVSVKGSSLMR